MIWVVTALTVLFLISYAVYRTAGKESTGFIALVAWVLFAALGALALIAWAIWSLIQSQ